MRQRLGMTAVGRCLLLVVFVLAGCSKGAGSASPAAVSHDEPVPPTEARDRVSLRLQLPPTQQCEEAFDLLLYEDRGVELIEWDEQRGRCDDRLVTITFLPGRISAELLIERVQEHADAAEVVQRP